MCNCQNKRNPGSTNTWLGVAGLPCYWGFESLLGAQPPIGPATLIWVPIGFDPQPNGAPVRKSTAPGARPSALEEPVPGEDDPRQRLQQSHQGDERRRGLLHHRVVGEPHPENGANTMPWRGQNGSTKQVDWLMVLLGIIMVMEPYQWMNIPVRLK